MIGLGRMKLETMIEEELNTECQYIDDIPNKDKICQAIACSVGIVIAKNNNAIEHDMKLLLKKS